MSLCSGQFIFNVIGKGENKGNTRTNFDDFHFQRKYLFLTLSFYNLIPSFKTCNSTFKRDKDWNLDKYVHPYSGGFGNCKFLPKPKQGKGIDFLLGKAEAILIILFKMTLIKEDYQNQERH